MSILDWRQGKRKGLYASSLADGRYILRDSPCAGWTLTLNRFGKTTELGKRLTLMAALALAAKHEAEIQSVELTDDIHPMDLMARR